MLSLAVSLSSFCHNWPRGVGVGKVCGKPKADEIATLMRSSDPGREFADMGGKAMCVTWMVENAPNAFAEARS